jgi:sugar lactone lactonase YvrE
VGKLYVSNQATNSIVRFDNVLAAATTGNLTPAATISGANTLLDKPSFLVADTAADRLYVTNPSTPAGTQSILVFDSISTKTGNVAPTRAISGAATGLTTPSDMALDKAKDELYVADGADILVFKPASSSSGNVAPARTLTVAFASISAIFLDTTNDILYVADPIGNAINVFDTASTLLTGAITANRTISGAPTGLSQPSSLRLDSNGRLVVTNFVTPSITIYGAAKTATGPVAPAATITGASTALVGPFQTAFNTAGSGELYQVDGTGKVLIFSNFSAATGNLPPTRNINGANTGISGGKLTAPTSLGVALDPTH